MRYGLVALVLGMACLAGCGLFADGLRDGAVAAATDQPVSPSLPAGSGWLDWLLYAGATALGYGGVATLRGYIRAKQEEK